jgi:hypothetical protein
LPAQSSPLPEAHPVTGVVQRQLSNGIRINYRKTDNEPRAAMIRVVAAGGRAMEGAPPCRRPPALDLSCVCVLQAWRRPQRRVVARGILLWRNPGVRLGLGV